ncbi:type VII secretion protein EccB [Nocardioides rubriscoriae]|uniref:type VII secretion protein EccB n=1 Tax=Nocardioides rubriscoriae TaxID=642762 RepID=UPI0011DFE3C6|nr:type VII secretion protein EccB [Nocardioides rubriscoriae]
MATKKDLVEAYSFSRRRLVTAFVSGAPGGREVEPTRPGRAVIGGLALAVLLVTGGAVLGVLKSPGFADLDQEGLVSEKESGADYAVLKVPGSDRTELRPLANITSAMLLFGADAESQKVSRDELDDKTIGAPIGILDAPATPPQQADLVQDGWTACTGVVDGDPVGIRVDLSADSDTTPAPEQSFVVRTASGRLFLVAQSLVGADRGVERAYAYPVPDGEATDRTLQAVAAASAADAVTVPDQWVTLFPDGGALAFETFGLGADLGEPWPYRAGVDGAQEARIGDLLEVGGTLYLMTGDGSLKLDDFSAGVYQALDLPGQVTATTYQAAQVPGGTTIRDASSLPDASWPIQVRPRQQAADQVCARLDVPGGQPGVVLATTRTGAESSPDKVGVDDVSVSVDSGAGAFVQSGGWSGEGDATPVLVDARGYAYPVGPGDETTRLGYGGVARVVVPQDWIGLFRVGVTLSIDAARCPPTSEPGGPCS